MSTTRPDLDPRELHREAQHYEFVSKVTDVFKHSGFTVFRQSPSNRRPVRILTGPPTFLAVAGPRIAAVWCPPSFNSRRHTAPRTDDLPANIEIYIVAPGELTTLPGRILAQITDRPHTQDQP
ncbi:hypothetical protein CcI49_17130 [Frankia sp. CcI49]|uniref:hypothetical protein n=1 Tax=Frankia sp. CcI49 TaxID=1745382 RepID=UPI000976B610|nr:hypothetical protein [Frankia sp. CcI49]ONH59664.1 hypothetical protein CcI49_17130 [Frankia sp. CcI49]